MPEPLISVCLPTHNRVSDLALRLDELLNQSIADLEIVVVDDGSTDGTEAHVRGVAEGDERVRYVPIRPGVGHPDVLWRCFKEARSDLVAIVHDHDAYRHDAIERLAAPLTAAPRAPFAFCAVRTVDPKTGQVLDVSSDPDAPSLRDDIVKHFIRTGSSLVGASAVMVRRDCLPDEPPARELGLFSDVDLWCRMAATSPVVYVSEALVDVVGWAPLEGLVKLNWARLGQLGDLRRRYLAESSVGFAERTRAKLTIRWSTSFARGHWVARLIAHAWLTRDTPDAALVAAPRAVIAAAKVASSAALRAAAR